MIYLYVWCKSCQIWYLQRVEKFVASLKNYTFIDRVLLRTRIHVVFILIFSMEFSMIFVGFVIIYLMFKSSVIKMSKKEKMVGTPLFELISI